MILMVIFFTLFRLLLCLIFFDSETCYGGYCEHEFFGSTEEEWESITLNEENDNSPTFFIRE